MDFRSLHYQEVPLLLCNVWDVPSAKAAEKFNFQAIGTSSAAIAASFGYNDGGKIGFATLFEVVKRISGHTHLPLTVDIEAGYGETPAEIAENIKALSTLGVAGVNIEDSIMLEERTLLNAELFAEKLSGILQILKKNDLDMFINIRTDVFLLGHPNPVLETQSRIRLYEQAGAHGIFTPCIERKEDIQAVVGESHVPINVMCMPNLPDFETLKELGVKRISMGNFLFDRMHHYLEKILTTITREQSFKAVFYHADHG